MKIEFNPDWSEFLRLLLSNDVKFLLVGGHAVAGHGEPRLTEDLDVFVEISPKNAQRIRTALVDFGLGSSAPSVKDLLDRGRIWMIGRKPWRIDILTEIDGVTFDECWKGRTHADFSPAPLPVIGRTELVKNKRASGRDKDKADLASLQAMQQRPSHAGKRKPKAAATKKVTPRKLKSRDKRSSRT